MSAYDRLAEFLAGQKADQWEASFSDIERVLRRPLPRSAFNYPAWWANQAGGGHSQTRGWRSVGWKTTGLDLAGRRVTFVRDRGSGLRGRGAAPGGIAPSLSLEAQFSRAAELTGIADREELIMMALQALVATHAAQQLAALGGSMPDYRAPDRERP